MRGFLLTSIASVFAFSSDALAHQAGQGTGLNNSGPGDLNRQRNFEDFQVGVTDSNRLTMRPVPVLPGEIVQGLEVHDAKGLVIGKVGTVGKGFATVTSAIGSVEVDFPSFAKNRNGLLINMPKSTIDALMVRGRPAP